MLPETFYRELPRQVRARAFTVSGLARLDQIQRVLDSLGDALENKTGFAAWKKQALADPALARLPRGRLDTIYRNATQQHYLAGHWQKHQRVKDARPFLIYDAINDSRTRPTHKAMDNYIAPVDDPVWNRWYPPNGHRCRCGVRSLTQAQAEARGWQGSPRPAPTDPDAGWNYHPGKDPSAGLVEAIERRLTDCLSAVQAGAGQFARKKRLPAHCIEGPIREHAQMLRAWTERRGEMPGPRDLVLDPLTEDSPEAMFGAFMAAFGGGSSARHTLPTGDEVLIDDQLFRRLGGGWKIDKRGRDAWLLYLADLIQSPQEVWRMDREMSDELYLLGRFQRGRQLLEAITVFERKDGGTPWSGKTAFVSDRRDYLEDKRHKLIMRGRLQWIQL